MSSEDKPKSGEVRLSITQSELDLLKEALGHYNKIASLIGYDRSVDARDLLTVIKSQTKETLISE